MSQRQSSPSPSPPSGPPAAARVPRERPVPLTVQHPHAAGIDVHSDMHMACVPADRDPEPVRRFGANTCDLRALADWLTQCGITTVALESTGVYWVPLFELLESRGFEVWLVEPGQLSRCGARPKTDVLDCQGIQRLHSYGLLRPSFRPPESVLALRGYWRQRQMQVRYAASHVQHMQKALDRADERQADRCRGRHRGPDWPSRNQGLRRFGGRFSRSSSLFLSGRLKRAMRWIMAM
jgi:transposase